MFTDIVGSVDLRRRIGDAAAAQIIRRHDDLFRRTVGAFAYAEILKDLGDGFLARFSSASDAVHAALHFQQTLRQENWNGESVQARIGLHLGEVSEMEVEETTGKPKLSGLAVDITARVMGLSLPGQILMTRAAFDNARQYVREHQSAEGSTPATTRKWMAHGRYLFKGAEEPLEVFEVGEVGIAPLRVPPDSEKARRAVAADQEETLGWRPAVGMDIPERKNWILDRKLGEGGFGEVWLGEHTQSKARRVFKFCFDAERLRSFKRELMLFRLLRDALGDRNDIAKLHEVQMDHPPFYLESEFTEDGSLVEWAQAQGGIETIPLETRLDIVARTAIAVAAAHSVGILHKDIKPSNILIYREHDGTVRPRLTDFGIGELTDPSVLTKGKFMVTGMGMNESLITGNESSRTGTRIYSPPEALVGKPFTIQGDVYALGILLYQMVVGDLERPLAQGWEREVADPLLREDIARCVEGHEDKRLSSAKELAERLQSLPSRRRARRRRQIARASVMASVLLVILLSLSAAWLVRERSLRVQTEIEYRKAKAVADFIVNMFTAVDPRENPTEGRNVKVVDKLDQAVKQLDAGELHDDPEIEAAIRAAIGNTYRSLSQFADAAPQLQKALDTRRTIDVTGDELGQTMEDVGAIKWFQNDLKQAEALFAESLEVRKAKFGEESLEVASSLNYLAAAIDKQESPPRHKDAEELYRRSLAIREKLASATNPDLIARTLNNLGTCVRDQGRFREAEDLFRRAVKIIEDKYGPEHVDVAGGLNNLGFCLYKQDAYAAAEPVFERSVAIKRKVLGEKHYSLAITLTGLGDLNQKQEKFEKAEQYYREVVEIRRGVFKPGHAAISSGLDGLAKALLAQKRFADAEAVLRDALENRLVTIPPEDWRVMENQSRLGEAIAGQGRFEEAESILKKAYEAIKAKAGDSNEWTIAAANRLAKLYEQTDRASLATALRASLNESKPAASP